MPTQSIELNQNCPFLNFPNANTRRRTRLLTFLVIHSTVVTILFPSFLPFSSLFQCVVVWAIYATVNSNGGRALVFLFSKTLKKSEQNISIETERNRRRRRRRRSLLLIMAGWHRWHRHKKKTTKPGRLLTREKGSGRSQSSTL